VGHTALAVTNSPCAGTRPSSAVALAEVQHLVNPASHWKCKRSAPTCCSWHSAHAVLYCFAGSQLSAALLAELQNMVDAASHWAVEAMRPDLLQPVEGHAVPPISWLQISQRLRLSRAQARGRSSARA
jgi:hypothetical protein